MGREPAATVSCYSHMPASPSMDCVGVSLCSGKTPLRDVFIWLNPLSDNSYEKATDIILSDVLQEYGAKTVYSTDGVLPFEVCSGCGEMSLRSVDESPPVRNALKVGRNDPCPCGSGKKYKNCCSKN